MKKKIYEKPNLNVEVIEIEDIIAKSGVFNDAEGDSHFPFEF